MDGDRNVLALPQAPDAIELRHLRAFVAVAEDLSFSRAAQRLFITQPALSRQVRSLERFVGCDLFRRSTQRVDLTLAGESLLARARALLADLDDAISSTRSVGGELASRMALLWEPWAGASAGDADLDDIRAAVEELHSKFGPPPGATVVPVIAGGVPALRVTPENPPDAVVLYLHGGGYLSGSAFGYRHLAGAIAVTSQASVLVVDYRLAPEHPHPAAVHDALNAYLWLLDSESDASKIIIVGDSSGGGLAMSLLLALRERDIPLPAGAVLLCPWIDLEGRTQRPPQESPALFSPDLARRCAHAYLGDQPGDDPTLDPLRTDLSRLPPILIHAASGDVVLQEAQLLAKHGQECGVDAKIKIYPVPTHAFHIFWAFLPEAIDAIGEIGQFIREITVTVQSDTLPSLRAAGGQANNQAAVHRDQLRDYLAGLRPGQRSGTGRDHPWSPGDRGSPARGP
ncbi:MAG: alpha/beta hydrolase fold domain-containing protein [Streptosporangiaceae bacterium]|jgi:acetyl esterase/lipase